jgi:Domain of unknown function (DUF1771)/Smr domain
MCVNGIEVDGE